MVDIEGYQGPLDQLVLAVQRGDIDPTTISMTALTEQVQQNFAANGAELRPAAETLTLLTKLLALKAQRVLPDTNAAENVDEEADVQSELGQRLVEYRLYKEVVDSLLTEPAEEGARSFASLVDPEVVPVERLRIPAERLAQAFFAVLQRYEKLQAIPVGSTTFSVEEKVNWLRELLKIDAILFEDIFAEVGSRLEAIACFLALLELLKRGEAEVSQDETFGPIRVAACG